MQAAPSAFPEQAADGVTKRRRSAAASPELNKRDAVNQVSFIASLFVIASLVFIASLSCLCYADDEEVRRL